MHMNVSESDITDSDQVPPPVPFQVSRLLRQSEQPIREQLSAVKSLRQEERCILGSCLEVLEDSLTHKHLLLAQPDVGAVS